MRGGWYERRGGSSLRCGARTITLSKPLAVRPSHWHRHWHHHRHHHRIYPFNPLPHFTLQASLSLSIFLSFFLSFPYLASSRAVPASLPLAHLRTLHPYLALYRHSGPSMLPEQPHSFVSRPYADTKVCNFGARNSRMNPRGVSSPPPPPQEGYFWSFRKWASSWTLKGAVIVRGLVQKARWDVIHFLKLVEHKAIKSIQ